MLTRKRKRAELRLYVWKNKDLRRLIFSFLHPAEGRYCHHYVRSLRPLPFLPVVEWCTCRTCCLRERGSLPRASAGWGWHNISVAWMCLYDTTRMTRGEQNWNRYHDEIAALVYR